MMAYEVYESSQDNFGKFIHQFQPETKTQNVSLLFYETCLNE